jgi:hypothetical protein
MRKPWFYGATVAIIIVVILSNSNMALATNSATSDECVVNGEGTKPIVSVESTTSGVYVKWQQINHEKFSGYKVVISEKNANPKYSEDGYLTYITDKSVTSWLVDNKKEYKNGDFDDYLTIGKSYYFSVTALYNCGVKIAGNAVTTIYNGPAVDDGREEKEKSDEEKNKIAVQKEAKKKENERLKEKAKLLKENDLNGIFAELKILRDLVKEQQAEIKYLKNLTEELKKISQEMKTAIANFVAYGADENTKKLGEGVRAAVINSYEKAYGQLPQDEDDLEDVLRIANGRFPNERNVAADELARKHFKKVYLREPIVGNANDEAALTIIAYGLRQKAENRNLYSERVAIKTFNKIYKYLPKTADDWDVVQAIAYSGAKR